MKKRLTIGVVIGNANSPHMRDVMKGIQNAADKMDCNIIYFLGVHMAPSFYAHFEDVIKYDFDYQYNVVYDYALFSGCDVLIISYGTISMFLDNPNKKEFLDKFSSIPYVLLLDRDDTGKASSIISNNYEGMYLVTEHLIKEHNYKKFAYLGGPNGNTDATERKMGFEDALRNYHISYDDKIFEVGDFTIRVDRQVNKLLDDNPGVEALVCANDLMADAAYKICAKRGLVVGKDIAITGYDDWEMASKMNPPLTTVTQSGFDTGFSAVEEAASLCKMGTPVERFVPTAIRIRNSCGCDTRKNNNPIISSEEGVSKKQRYIKRVVDSIVDQSLTSTVNPDIISGARRLINPLIEKVVELVDELETVADAKVLLSNLTMIEKSPLRQYISVVSLVDAIETLVIDRIKREDDTHRLKAYAIILSYIQKFTRSMVEKQNVDDMTKYQSDTMFMPYISLEMMSHIEDVKDFYKSAMSMLSAMEVPSSYIFTSEHVMRHSKEDEWKLPEKLYLMAFNRYNTIVCNDFAEAPILNKEHTIASYFNRDERYTINVYDIFMGENQYGILVTETDPQNMLLMNLVSMQISSAINFRRLYVRQKQLGKELENAVSQLEEKNRILGFLSEYDQLTGCLNRRGFAEKAEALFNSSYGMKGMLIMADLDHLKEINDTFGHSEGDFSIKSSASILQTALGMDTLISRIGGDEFVALYLFDNEELSGENVREKIKTVNEEFTSGCDKPYYIELSIGYHEFVIDKDTELQNLMKEADKVLYVDKTKRRKSVKM